ncbi:hypothetical protein E1B28_009808 [Marasmius oreades]|uniref:Disintegrin and metalloproteinase domain-containing protein B n=1 Tax=Marasmius oreades TaxID=181124 RepID=A0A9P7RWK2_9AGAR|nr:uncharacterized protein E1B28_009808 [Marasmius oreades]KAG7090715.1 hypothetical protein E1B28_009808 [Marasmius oreades]
MKFSQVFSVSLHALVVAVFMFSGPTTAHSQANRPLKRLAHPSTLSIEILPRTKTLHLESRHLQNARTTILHHNDSFRLVLSAFDEIFYLHLRPNDHLIHPAARITYFSPDGQPQSQPLQRESVKAYLGEVIHESHSKSRMREDAAGLVYHGNREGELGWARMMVWHQGDDSVPDGSPVFEGAFSARGDIYHVMTKDNYLKTKGKLDAEIGINNGVVGELDEVLVIWRESDLMSPEEEALHTGVKVKPQTCGHDGLQWNVDPSVNQALQSPVSSSNWSGLDFLNSPFGMDSLSNFSLARRDTGGDAAGGGMSTNFVGSIGKTDGCPTSQKILYMGVAADCEYVKKYGTKENATQKILNDWNMASSLYKTTFKVSLGIVELQVQNPDCPAQADSNLPWNVDCNGAELDNRLSIFSQWRGDKGNDGIGLWHLMSGCPTGSEVGIAWLATLCQQTAGGTPGNVVSGTGVSTAGITEWQVVAHEIGHNFGAIHDCADGCESNNGSCCPLASNTNCSAKAKFIMSPVAQTGEKTFSPCTIGNVCSLMKGGAGGQTNTSCLDDPGVATRTTFTLKMCGNGIVEDGEDCDPGAGNNSTCCDVNTCKFKNEAVCDPSNSPCCTNQCTFAPKNQVCRPSKDDRCDVAETCPGNSGACPKDVTKPNGQSCGSDGLACASGQCTSLSAQCKSAGGPMGLTTGCQNRGDGTCRISCEDPSKSNSCVLLSSLLIDGSPCGYGGSCASGTCQAGNLFDTAKAWYTQNLQIAIPVTVVAGILLILLVILLLRCLCRLGGNRQVYSEPVVVPTLAHQRLGSDMYGPYPSMQPPQVPQISHPPITTYSTWVDERPYNGR